MIVGIDFDNTIVCYDGAFHRAALERKLIPASIPKTKESVRDYLRAIGQEDDWTELQGHVYGTRMETVSPFSGVAACIRRLKEEGTRVYVISHKTIHPFRGPLYNLHESARNWLTTSGFLEETGLALNQIFFELTKQEKLARIGVMGCTHFIDDLPELLCDKAFPQEAVRMLFTPDVKRTIEGIRTFRSWDAITEFFRGADVH